MASLYLDRFVSLCHSRSPALVLYFTHARFAMAQKHHAAQSLLRDNSLAAATTKVITLDTRFRAAALCCGGKARSWNFRIAFCTPR